ncbi:hypothetical protein NE634_20505, partial [Lacrimispora saccharolytica]|nr:hypothetical protein [Lacrimispora saccharolytica]
QITEKDCHPDPDKRREPVNADTEKSKYFTQVVPMLYMHGFMKQNEIQSGRILTSHRFWQNNTAMKKSKGHRGCDLVRVKKWQ